MPFEDSLDRRNVITVDAAAKIALRTPVKKAKIAYQRHRILLLLCHAPGMCTLLCTFLATRASADTYRRQPGVDVVHYEIAVELADGSDTIAGMARIHIMVQEPEVSTMWLDLEEMTVESLKVAGANRPFTDANGRLSFDFGRTYRRHEIAIVEVKYRGRPNAGMLIGKNKYGRQVYFAENWPDRARRWFPGIDHPSDKATVDFSVTAPEKYEVVANGRLVESRSLLDGRKIWRWNEKAAIPTYCMVIGVAEFAVTHLGTVLNIPLTLYAYPQDLDGARRMFARSNLIVQYFTDLIGPYPYEKLAQVQSTTRIGGMENASVIFYAEDHFQRADVREGAVPHEIAHQWFGDAVTPSDWDHLWISEGFATYFSALFHESLEGPESLKRQMERAADTIKRFHQTRPTPLIDPELTDVSKKLNAFNYQKGAWTLHMLRKMLGDQTFFGGIRRYYTLYAGKNASTEDFQKVMEATSGIVLERFFKQWFYQPGWPVYDVTWRWNEKISTAEITFHQLQQTGLFDMPLDIAFRTGNTWEVRTVRISEQRQTVEVRLTARPSSIEVDPDGWVLKSVRVANPQ